MREELSVSDLIPPAIVDESRWLAYKARTRQLDPTHRPAIEAIERYLLWFQPISDDRAASMFEDVANLFEQAAENGLTLREILGEDPVDVVDALLRNHAPDGRVALERERLAQVIDRAVHDEADAASARHARREAIGATGGHSREISPSRATEGLPSV